MQLNINILEQRWAMMTNPFAMLVPPLCKATDLEIMEHLIWLDAICDGRRLTESEIKESRERFERFCRTQWENRNIN